MLSRHEIYETSDSSPAQKIIIFLAIAVALVLTVIIGNFVYEFIQSYHQWLSHALFYLLSVVGVATVILIAAFTAYAVGVLMLRYESKRLDSLQQAQDLQAKTANNALFSATTEQISAGRVYLSEQKNDYGVVKFKSLAKAPKPTEPLLSQTELDTMPDIKDSLLNDIEQAQRLLIVGGQNSGKTTLLKHIARQRSGAGSVLVLDSHNTFGKWSADYRIVGHGRDYSAIENELKNLVAVMDSRYKELASGKVGERQHELITVICDEWTTVSKNLNNLDIYLLPLLTESRKVGIDLILATHSQTADSLGLKGKADLKSAFDAVLILKNISGKRIVELNNGDEMVIYHHCGNYNYSDTVFNLKKELSKSLDKILSDDAVKNTAIIDKYHELKSQGNYSENKLCKAIYGYSNGQKVAEIRAVLSSYGIVTSQ